MRPRLKRSIVAIGTAVVIATLWSATGSVAGGQIPATGLPAYTAPRNAYGEPDLNGFWAALNTANWNIEEHPAAAAPYEQLVAVYLAQPPGFGVVEGGPIPYRPDALERRNRNFESRLKPEPLPGNSDPYDDADPEAKCFTGGVPRATYMPFPFQIIHAKNRVLIAYTFGASSTREIHLDKTFADLLEVYDYPGQSIGRWEGNTLVVDVRWFNTWVWLDRAGNYYSENAHVEERYTPISPYHLMYEVTIDDPTVFTRPWKMRMPLYRIVEPSTRLQILEFQCVPFADEFMYGKFKKGVFKLPDVDTGK